MDNPSPVCDYTAGTANGWITQSFAIQVLMKISQQAFKNVKTYQPK